MVPICIVVISEMINMILEVYDMTQKMFYSTAAGFVMVVGLSITSYAATG